MDLSFLLPLLYAGAGIAGTTAVQETTKSAYNALKTKVGEVFGTRATTPLTALEAEPTKESIKGEVAAALTNITPAEHAQLVPLMTALADAFQADQTARSLAQDRAAIRLNLNAGGNLVIERIQGASLLDVKADAAGDLSVSDITMRSPTDPGN